MRRTVTSFSSSTSLSSSGRDEETVEGVDEHAPVDEDDDVDGEDEDVGDDDEFKATKPWHMLTSESFKNPPRTCTTYQKANVKN